MVFRTALVGALVVSLPFAASAQTQSAVDSEEEVAEIEDDDEMVCRRTAITGSRFKKRICATRREWRELSDRGRDQAQDLQRRGRGQEPAGR